MKEKSIYQLLFSMIQKKLQERAWTSNTIFYCYGTYNEMHFQIFCTLNERIEVQKCNASYFRNIQLLLSSFLEFALNKIFSAPYINLNFSFQSSIVELIRRKNVKYEHIFVIWKALSLFAKNIFLKNFCSCKYVARIHNTEAFHGEFQPKIFNLHHKFGCRLTLITVKGKI